MFKPERTKFILLFNSSVLQWKEAFETGHFKTPPPISGEEVLPSGEVPTIRSVMAFDGAPELINARLAMVGFLAALGAELASGEGVVMQVNCPLASSNSM